MCACNERVAMLYRVIIALGYVITIITTISGVILFYSMLSSALFSRENANAVNVGCVCVSETRTIHSDARWALTNRTMTGRLMGDCESRRFSSSSSRSRELTDRATVRRLIKYIRPPRVRGPEAPYSRGKPRRGGRTASRLTRAHTRL